jgi:hypothetical protein
VIAVAAAVAVALTAVAPGVAQAAPPANDAFAGATPVATVPATVEAELADATAEPGEPDPSCSSYSQAPSVWFAFTAPRTESITLQLASEDFDTVVAVHSGDSLGSLTEVYCESFDRGVLAVTVGQTYRIQLVNAAPEAITTRLVLAVAPDLQTEIGRSVFDPSTLDTVEFFQYPSDTLGAEITSVKWDLGDGTTSDDAETQHRYTADGDYVVRVTITSADGRSATATQDVPVWTHDVRVAAFTTPSAGRVGRTKPIEVTVGNQRISEDVTVVLYRGGPGGFAEVARATQYVPSQPNRTVAFPFNYTFSPADAEAGRVTFRTVVSLADGSRDARVVDNEATAPATTVHQSADGLS